ncbi:MAG: fatty acyl-AMP ligase [Myxococcaceae bacterium]|jgi:fatty-acyl-CoA synthase|nr:fatty acyl-AMP ligase [Myxococcaceae bacterium]MCA3014341.1 fatty acyl-AMP ligase [Myxococcaceae bacterium]
MAAWNAPSLIAAIDESKGLTDKGYTFLDRDQKEQFFSWDDLRTEAMKRAAHLRKYGLKKGDRVAMVLPDGEDFVPTFLGAIWAGLVPVPLYPPLSLGKLDSYKDTLVAILNKAEPAYLITLSKMQQVLWAGLTHVKSLKGVITAEELKGPAPEGVSQDPAQVTDDDLAFLQFTSGSTSTPKGVSVTHGNLRANAWAIMVDGLKTDSAVDHGVSWLPLYHDMGLIGFVIAPMFHKVQVTFIPTMAFVRQATLWLETIHRVRGTITFAPNFAYALATKRTKAEQLARWDLSCVKAFGCGAEPINSGTMRTFVETMSKAKLKPEALLPCYGMAEATLAISFIGLDEALSTDVVDTEAYQKQRAAEPVHVSKLAEGKAQEFVNCGKTFPGHEVGIFDDQGARLGERKIGEIQVRGPSVAKGYFRDADATERTFGGGWLKTGDLGYLANGNVYIVGRKKDIIIINGRNYDPQRIEWLVDDVAGVRKGSSVAFSKPGPSSEELIVVLEARTASETELEALKESVKQRIVEQMQLTPADVVVCPVGSLPKTSSGKLQRSKTRQQYLDGTVGKEGNRSLGSNAEKVVLARHVAMSLLGRSRHRARRIAEHALEVKSVTDALGKLKLAGDYVSNRLGKLF